jgi:hypothetical protein
MLRPLTSATARKLRAIPRTRTRPRCCRWASTGPHRWEREPVHCGDKWEEISLLYWLDRYPKDRPGVRPADYAFCRCGHTVACHLTAAELAELEARSGEGGAA